MKLTEVVDRQIERLVEAIPVSRDPDTELRAHSLLQAWVNIRLDMETRPSNIDVSEPAPEPTRRHPEPSWSPDLITTSLSFGQALVAMKAGKKVRRPCDFRPLMIMDDVIYEVAGDNMGTAHLTSDRVLATDWEVVN